jgi:hypothetical protein
MRLLACSAITRHRSTDIRNQHAKCFGPGAASANPRAHPTFGAEQLAQLRLECWREATRRARFHHGGVVSLLDDKDRDPSWKRLLRADTRVPNREARRELVRSVLARIDVNDVIGSLQAIVAEGLQGADDIIPVPGFRGGLVASRDAEAAVLDAASAFADFFFPRWLWRDSLALSDDRPDN